jgi:hypothetical protein
MVLDHLKPWLVKFSMFDFIDNLLDDVWEDMKNGTAITPAADINPNATLLPKLLYLCKRTRPDIQVAVAFLSTRVNKPDQDNYMKLQRLVQYLQGNKDLPLTFKA